MSAPATVKLVAVSPISLGVDGTVEPGGEFSTDVADAIRLTELGVAREAEKAKAKSEPEKPKG